MTEEEIIEVVDHKRRGGRLYRHGYRCNKLMKRDDKFNFQGFTYSIHPSEQPIISHLKNGGQIWIKGMHDANSFVYKLGVGDMDWDNNEFFIKPPEDAVQGYDGIDEYIKRNGVPTEIKVPNLFQFLNRPTVNEKAIQESISYILECLNEITEKIK